MAVSKRNHQCTQHMNLVCRTGKDRISGQNVSDLVDPAVERLEIGVLKIVGADDPGCGHQLAGAVRFPSENFKGAFKQRSCIGHALIDTGAASPVQQPGVDLHQIVRQIADRVAQGLPASLREQLRRKRMNDTRRILPKLRVS